MGKWGVRVAVVLLIVAATLGFSLKAKRQMIDFGVYLTAGERVLAGENLYRESDGHWQFKYLPAFAFVVAPLSLLPVVVARGIWFAFGVVLLVLFVRLSLKLLPDRRLTLPLLVALTVLAMGKFYVRELGLGQTNILLAVLAMLALQANAAGREALSGVCLGAATLVKPYAILFWPWLVARGRYRAAAWFAGTVVAGVVLPVARYGVAGNIDLIAGLWHVVTTSTAPNLAGQDNVSIAGMWASWLGVGPLAGRLSSVTVLLVLLVTGWTFWQEKHVTCPAYLETGVLLLLIPLISPQGWDYVLLMGTPLIAALIDRADDVSRPWRLILIACLLIVGLSIWDIMGRDLFKSFMMARIVTVCALIELGLALRLRHLRLA